MRVLRPSTPKSNHHRRIAARQQAMLTNSKLVNAAFGYMYQKIQDLEGELNIAHILLNHAGRE